MGQNIFGSSHRQMTDCVAFLKRELTKWKGEPPRTTEPEPTASGAQLVLLGNMHESHIVGFKAETDWADIVIGEPVGTWRYSSPELRQQCMVGVYRISDRTKSVPPGRTEPASAPASTSQQKGSNG